MPWSWFFKCWLLIQLFTHLFYLHQEALQFLFTFCHLGVAIWGYWYLSQLYIFSSVQTLSHVWLFATQWTEAQQASLSISLSNSCPTPRVDSNSCPLSWWCQTTISFSAIPFSTCPQSFPASGSFQMSQFFDQSIGVSASTSIFPMNIQDWFYLGWTGWISLQSKRLSRVFSNTIVQKLQLSRVKQITIPLEWDKCLDLVHWEDPEGLGREGVGGGIGMGNTCKSMADSCQCMAKTTTIL